MKYLVIISLMVLSFCSCQREIKCNFADFNVAPCGFNLQKIGTISPNNLFLDFQMIDANVGYAHSFQNSIIELFKTKDGGKTWNNWNVSYNNSPFSLLFTDENHGYIAQLGDTLQASMMITSDGGLTWTEREYPDLHFFKSIVTDQYGNIYSNSNTTTHLIKSSDKGLSWVVINSLIPSSPVTISILEDQIFIGNFSTQIYVTDLEGNFIKKIPVQETNNLKTQMKVIDSMNIVMTSFYSTIKTSDGGENWSVIYDLEADILDFPSSEIGLMVMSNGYCDFYPATVLGLTNDGGQTWMRSEEMNDFKTYFKRAQKVGENHYLLLVGGDIYELKR